MYWLMEVCLLGGELGYCLSFNRVGTLRGVIGCLVAGLLLFDWSVSCFFWLVAWFVGGLFGCLIEWFALSLVYCVYCVLVYWLGF